MPIWKGRSVEETPVIRLSCWRVFEVASKLWEGKTRHLVGYNLTEREGRVSSEIKKIDPVTRRVATRSGRQYELMGVPGSGGADGLYTWNWFCDINEITESVDVTKEMFDYMRPKGGAADAIRNKN